MLLLRFLRRLFLVFLLLLALIGAALGVWLPNTKPSPRSLPPLQDGDLVFQTIQSHQTTAIMLASHSWFTHVGIIKLRPGKTPLVLEAVGPVREITLSKWIKQGIGERLEIMRLPDLTSAQAAGVLAAAAKDNGKEYDFHFTLADDKIYCSELAYRAYESGAGIKLGQLQKTGMLDLENFAVQKLLRERWPDHPQCQTPETKSFETCLAVIKQQDIITPESLARDPRLVVIYSNYPF